MTLYDITIPTHPDLPVWPGGKRFNRTQPEALTNGDICNLSLISMSVHTGTHIDSPLHFVDGTLTTAEIPLDQLIGDCVVADLQGKTEITRADLEALRLPKDTKKLLFKTDNSELWENPSHEFEEGYCALTPDGAEWVRDFGIHLLGIDYLSVSLYKDPPEIVHRILLEAGMVLIEGIDLREVEPGAYRVYCMPFQANDLEGSPARVVLEC
jgi:arylformamidase